MSLALESVCSSLGLKRPFLLAQTSTSIQDAALFAERLWLPNDGRYRSWLPRKEREAIAAVEHVRQAIIKSYTDRARREAAAVVLQSPG